MTILCFRFVVTRIMKDDTIDASWYEEIKAPTQEIAEDLLDRYLEKTYLFSEELIWKFVKTV